MFYLFRWKINMELYEKLEKYNLKDAIEIEKTDRQFLALEKLWRNIKNGYPQGVSLQLKYNYLFLIITNSLICYQLSWKWEDYWEEFWTSPLTSLLIGEGNNNFTEIYNFFEKFIPESKNNRRFIDIKLKRVKKTESFYLDFISKPEFYYKNMDILALELSKTMKQKIDAKTIVFAVKMFSYWARNIYDFEYFPEDLMIPIDSRLENLYKKYKKIDKNIKINIKEIKIFYIELSKKLKIPLLHLDAILWVNYDELIK